LPGGDVLYPEMLENVRNLPVLCVWGENDIGEKDGKPVPDSSIAGANRRMLHVIQTLKLEHVTPIQLTGVGHIGPMPPGQEVSKWISSKREHYPKKVHQGFRLAETSQAYWVRVTALQGEPLPDSSKQKYKVVVEPGEDPQEALAKYLRKNLGIVHAEVNGQ